MYISSSWRKLFRKQVRPEGRFLAARGGHFLDPLFLSANFFEKSPDNVSTRIFTFFEKWSFFADKNWPDFSAFFQKNHDFQKITIFLIKKWPFFKNVDVSIFEKCKFVKNVKIFLSGGTLFKKVLSTGRRGIFILSEIPMSQGYLQPLQNLRTYVCSRVK